MDRPSLGIAVASSNEADLLRNCLAAASGVDEIVVFDLGAQDNTTEVANAFGATVVSHERVPFVEQLRGDQLAAASTDWILFLDPDEVLPAGWVEAVRQLLQTKLQACAGCWIAYQEVSFGAPLKVARKGAAKIALVRRSAARAIPAEVVRPHQPLLLDGGVCPVIPELPLIDHHGYRTVRGAIEKLSRYASAGGVGTTTHDTMPRPLTCIKMLWGSVVMSGAWRDGSPGVAVASLSAIGDYLGLLQRWDEQGHPVIGPTRGERVGLPTAMRGHSLQRRARALARRGPNG